MFHQLPSFLGFSVLPTPDNTFSPLYKASYNFEIQLQSINLFTSYAFYQEAFDSSSLSLF